MEEEDNTFSRKVALGRLLPSLTMRDQIERTLEVMQTMAVRGSLVATTILLRHMESGSPCPPINNSNWWSRCLKVCGRKLSMDNNPIKRIHGPLEEPEGVARELFKNHVIVYYDYMSPFIATIVGELMDATKRMVITIFHKSLAKAFWRELSLFERLTASKLADKDRKIIIQAIVMQTVGHKFAQGLPSSCPLRLKTRLGELKEEWSAKYTNMLPLANSKFIFSSKLPKLVEWLFDLELHRRDCLQRMALALPVNLPQWNRCVEDFFLEKSAKPQPLLPRCKVDIRHISVNPTTLVSLVNGAVYRSDMDEAFRIKTKTAPLDVFLTHFPGLCAYQRQRRCRDDTGRLLLRSIRTDGVVASVFFSSTIKGSVRGHKDEEKGQKRKRGSIVETTTNLPSYFEEHQINELKEVSGCSVPMLEGKKRIVSIDPGSRDMIFALIDDNRSPADDPEVFSLPSSEFVKRTRRWKAEEIGTETLRRTRTRNALGKDTNLYDARCSLPTYRDVFGWQIYLDAYLPILDDLLRCKRRRILRRAQYDHFLRRDRVLDQVIKELTGGSLSPSSCRETHIALGSAAAYCSLARGHDSVSMSRFRWRMEKVHNIAVTLVDEFRTSKNCSTCRVARLYEVKVKKRSCWALKACPCCRNSSGTGPKVWHRDLNAAFNIRACFYARTAGQDRPTYLDRAVGKFPDSPRQFHPELNPFGARRTRKPSARISLDT